MKKRDEIINECANEITKVYVDYANTPIKERGEASKWIIIARDRVEKLKYAQKI